MRAGIAADRSGADNDNLSAHRVLPFIAWRKLAGALPLGHRQSAGRFFAIPDRYGFVAIRCPMNRREFVTIGSFAVVQVPLTARAQQASPTSSYNQFAVSIPHHLARPEALRRLKSGLASLQRDYSYLFTIQDEKWSGYHLAFRASVMGQTADGTIDVAINSVYLSVALPFLLALLARAAEPLIAKQGTALLERK
jgi:hypothetical protein